jgi:hypothetical protein
MTPLYEYLHSFSMARLTRLMEREMARARGTILLIPDHL